MTIASLTERYRLKVAKEHELVENGGQVQFLWAYSIHTYEIGLSLLRGFHNWVLLRPSPRKHE